MFVASSRLHLLLAFTGILISSSPTSARQHYHHGYREVERNARNRIVSIASVIQCVAFAKQDAGIDISGDARDWWGNAAGVYQRGSRPETGSVLSFHENGRMPLGHVAVVSGIEDSRTIVIDQSHWNSRGITRGVVVQDVSDDNDWTAVRVQVAHGTGFGSIYLTHGFIYPRTDQIAFMSGAVDKQVRKVSVNTTKPDFGMVKHAQVATEIAEAPSRPRPIDLTIRKVSTYDLVHAVK